MKFTSLRTSDFRNLEIENVKTDSKSVILTGPNGQGKTNILEALYILSYGSSFRTSYLKECVSWGKDGFYISGDYEDEDEYEKGNITVSFFSNQRKIILDGKEVKDRK